MTVVPTGISVVVPTRGRSRLTERLWTKFVYVDRQLLGERDRRVRQMWACFVALLVLGCLLAG